MPRKPRLHIPGGFYHVILRGNGRQAIFFDGEDRERWEALLEKGLQRYGHRVHAYCWMTNHVHLAMQAGDEPLADIVRFVASQYARWLNRKRKRSGHVFERRYRGILVQEDAYLAQLVRYIHLNPVRAALSVRPADYQWSSHRAYLGDTVMSWLTVDRLLYQFGSTLSVARRRYRSFMREPPSKMVMAQFIAGGDHDDRVLGDDGFLESVERRAEARCVKPSLDKLILAICQEYDVREEELRAPGKNRRFVRIRAHIANEALSQRAATLAVIARRFDRSEAAISRALTRLRCEMLKS